MTSVASQFDDFVNRSSNFGSLAFDASNSRPADVASGRRSEPSSRVLVVEEFPTSMTRSSSALEGFRSVISRYLAASPPGSKPSFRPRGSVLDTRPPLVLIISESLLTSATASADSFTAHRLLGPDITNHPLVTVMEFNTVAPTFIAKALDLVIKKEARDSQRRRIPGPAVMKKLSEMGDIRSAVNALEFLCARSADNDDWSGRVAAKMKKSYKDGAVLTAMEKSSLELVTQREATLGMFHAVGKVVYNKREEPQMADPTVGRPPKPPDHLEHMHKPKTPQVNVDDLMNETGTDIPTFVSTLHENYILSCNGLSFLGSFENCIDALSDSDILSPEGGSMTRIGYGRGSGLSHAGGIDMLRQNEITFHVAVRGLLFGLPYPVNRAAYPGGRKGDAFKMFYPASLRLWKPMEETGSLITTLMDQTMFASPTGAARGRDSGNNVASWKQKNDTFGATSEDENSSTASRILASKTDMLYDRLPYLSKFHNVEGLDMQKVKHVTQFRGTRLPEEEEEYEGYELETAIDLSAANETTDGPTASPKKRGRIMTITPSKVNSAGVPLKKGLNNDVQLEKLYISDDDIQDD
jgi:cell cycle checkpoint protein